MDDRTPRAGVGAEPTGRVPNASSPTRSPARERRAAAHDDARAVLCHGDLHELNALQADDGTFRLIDPEGVVAEPEYDLGVLMRNAPGEDDLHERADWLAAATGCDRTAIWEWGTAERVLSGLWCRVVDHQPHGDKQLADAERLCAPDR